MVDMEPELVAEVQRLFSPEDGAKAAARSRASEAVRPPSPEVGSFLRWVAATGGVDAAVEVGGAGGVSGLWLLDGMGPKGVLTSIEVDPHAHGLATASYAEADTGSRVRAILGQPDAVLPRLSDGAYDLMLLQSGPSGYVDALDHARRLLRPGGVLMARGVLRRGDHADNLARFLDELSTDDRLTATVFPVDDGLALATYHGAAAADGTAS